MTLKIDHISRSFGSVKAVKDVWLEAPEGAVMGIIGPNGAGKTTTIRMILSILTPETGSVTWAGKPVEHWPLGTFGYLPEERGLYPQMRGRDELRFFGKLHGLSEKQADQEIDHWAESLSLKEALPKKVEELSKGNAQKLQFLAAVLHRPRLVILDEPFSGLDPLNTRLFKDAVRHLHDMGSTILFSSHQMDYVEELCDKVCLIAEGRTLVHGALDEVRRNAGVRVLTLKTTANEAARSYLASVAGVRFMEEKAGLARYELQPSIKPDALLPALINLGDLQHFSVDYPTLEDVYVASVTKRQGVTDDDAAVTGGAGQ